ncbi:pancreatic secretory granule membrane major glycoprotein GP2 [Trichomycterus rosablanca]|uniref:pancreatic secretory granule membrane major glycoprotein GP2 n=1 Tax=Trichomycterus rosablanca TaxID=2290929 RepID=UPI002F353885
MSPASLALFWCLFTFWTLIPAVYLDEEELNETVICTNEHIQVLIPSAFFLSKDPPVYIWDLHLNDPECRGAQIKEDYVFTIKTNFTDCGTNTPCRVSRSRTIAEKMSFTLAGYPLNAHQMVIQITYQLSASDNDYIMFTNTIHNNETEIITRSYVNITFGCRYPLNYMVQQPNGENMIQVNVRTITLNTEDGNFSVSMLLYKDEDFEDKWTTVPSLMLEDSIYVKIYMIPGNLILRAERCWATPNNDPYSNIQYTFIKDSCPLLETDQTLEVIKNGQGPEALFRIQMFKFVGSSYTDIFLHCNVQICHSSARACQALQNCSVENSSSRSRRDVTMSHTVSYGPIKKLQVTPDQSPTDVSVPSVETFVLGGMLVVLLLITGVFGRLWLLSRRSYPPQEAQLTLSNIHHISDVAT